MSGEDTTVFYAIEDIAREAGVSAASVMTAALRAGKYASVGAYINEKLLKQLYPTVWVVRDRLCVMESIRGGWAVPKGKAGRGGNGPRRRRKPR